MPILRPLMALLFIAAVALLASLNTTVQAEAPLFNEHLEWDEASKLATRALEGDAEAIEQLREGRLAYAPLLLRHRNMASRTCPGHRLLRENLAWVRKMQAWESALAGLNPDAIADQWESNRHEFRVAEAQLARAIISVGQLGDKVTRNRLVAHAPDNPLTTAALAQVGVPESPRERAEAILDALPAIFLNIRYDMIFDLHSLDDRISRHPPFSDAHMDAETDLLFTTDGVNRLRSVPQHWNSNRLANFLGTLAAQVGDADFVESVETRFLEAYREHGEVVSDEAAEAYRVQIRVAAIGNSEASHPFTGQFAQVAVSAVMHNHLKGLEGDYPLARRFGAVTVFHSAPHWSPGRRMMLEQVQRMRDPVLTRLAARAVLALNDDCLDAIVDIAAALREPEDRERFGAALAGTGHIELQNLARQMADDSSIPPRPWARAELSLQHRATLVEAFAAEDELGAYGGAIPVYLMNLAAFKFARNGLFDGVAAYADALEASAQAVGRERAFAAAQDAFNVLDMTAFGEDRDRALSRIRRSHPVAYAALRFEQACNAGHPPADATESELLNRRLNEVMLRRQEFDTADLDRARKDIVRSGASGLSNLAFILRGQNETTHEAARWEPAERAGPTNFQIWLSRSGLSERMGYNRLQNWFAIERVALAMILLRPNLMHTIQTVSAVFARSGEPPRAVGALLTSGLQHPMSARYYQPAIIRFTYFHFARGKSNEYVARFTTQHHHAVAHKRAFRNANRFIRWGYDPWTPLEGLGIMGLRPEFCMTYAWGELGLVRPSAGLYLDFALETSRIAPELALGFVDTAIELGVSEYGYFVGSQTYIRAQAALGNVDAALERFASLRGGHVGYPPYLDRNLLNGLAEGNQHEHVERALKEIQRYRLRNEADYIHFTLRRALMAIERHSEVAEIAPQKPSPAGLASHNLGTYSELFHEARALLDAENYRELIRRTGRYWQEINSAPDSIGTQVDAAVLFAVARKLHFDSETHPYLTEEGRFNLLDPAMPYYFVQTPWLLDQQLLRILAGLEEPDALPLDDPDWHWHGSRYSERPFVNRGTAILTGPQLAAREQFIHGALHWLRGESEGARRHLENCVKADQRFSHEYHTAKWLLDEHLAE